MNAKRHMICPDNVSAGALSCWLFSCPTRLPLKYAKLKLLNTPSQRVSFGFMLNPIHDMSDCFAIEADDGEGVVRV